MGPHSRVQVKPSCCAIHISHDAVTAVSGTPRDREMHAVTAADVALLLKTSVGHNTEPDWEQLRGRFAIVHIDLTRGAVTLATDRFGVFPLCCSIEGSRIAFSDRADSVPYRSPRQIDPQAIFNYVYFHVIPAPRTIFRGVQRIEPATRLRFDPTGLHSKSTWQPAFIAQPDFNVKVEGERFRALLQQSIEREVTTPRIGAFLSGGTDSSTVVGLLGQVTGEPVRFLFDRLRGKRLRRNVVRAPRCTAFQLQASRALHHSERTSARRFRSSRGTTTNRSAIRPPFPPTTARALHVSIGIEKLLAGDGGDELFGGNTRYARQKVFDAYYAVPASIRQRAIEPLLLQSSAARYVPGLKKLVPICRASSPSDAAAHGVLQPARSLWRQRGVHIDVSSTSVNIGEPRDLQREIYQSSVAQSIIDRMLAYDWRFTLADSDLPKVRCHRAACRGDGRLSVTRRRSGRLFTRPAGVNEGPSGSRCDTFSRVRFAIFFRSKPFARKNTALACRSDHG